MTKEESFEVVDRMLMAAFGDRKVINQFCEILAEQIKDRLIYLLVEEGFKQFEYKEEK